MTSFFKTKAGMISAGAFILMMALVTRHVVAGRNARDRGGATSRKAAPAGPAVSSASPTPPPASTAPAATIVPVRPTPSAGWTAVAENAAYMDRIHDLDRRVREDHDRQGNPVTRRLNASTPNEVGHAGSADEIALNESVPFLRSSLRLQGRPGSPRPVPLTVSADTGDLGGATEDGSESLPPATAGPLKASPADGSLLATPSRFNPYGRVIKCELVFTIDSTNEQTPLVAVVMEPVYNNGLLVVPAGAELHGFARPDRVRDRLFSDQDWVLVFPRENGRPNGRQLNVRGVALDRLEPDANGMTWGITDGSYGLEGKVIRSMSDEEIKRFVATFLAAGSVTLQQKEPAVRGRESIRNTPQNAVLQGLAANFEQVAVDLSAEIAAHGVFIRIPAGHQFYFYPMQIIDADAAGVSSNIATVK